LVEPNPPAQLLTLWPSPQTVNEAHTSVADAERAARRRRRVTLFFVAWTVFAVGAGWWLLHSESSPVPEPPFLLDHSQASQAPFAERLRVWLKLADLNFRGAYPWVLLAPYVAWLALRFPLERGRLHGRIPLYLAAYAVFAGVCHLLTSRQEARGQKIVVIAGYDTQTNLDFPGFANFTNKSGLVLNGVLITNPSQLPPGELEKFAFASNHLPPGAERGFGGPTISRHEFEIGTNVAGGGVTHIRATGWNSVFWTAPRPLALALDFLAFGALMGSAHAVHFYRRFREREQRAVLLESSLAQARLSALQAQLHPHFLFNALNAVATLIRANPAAALETLTSFSDLLRLALSQSEKHEIPLREDLQFLESYLEIQQVRLGDRLRVERDVDPAALDCLVPALLMQPLVENALRHGIEPSPNPGTVQFTVRVVGEKLVLTIADNGVGLAVSQAANSMPGIGLANLRTRLTTLYGNNQLLEVGPNPGGGVLVRVELPCRTEPPAASRPTP
jgi:two-component sensor histidine kinase